MHKKIFLFLMFFCLSMVLLGCNSINSIDKLDNMKSDYIEEINNWILLNCEKYNEYDWITIESNINEKIKFISGISSEKKLEQTMLEVRQKLQFIEDNYSIQTTIKICDEEPFTESSGTENDPYIIDNTNKFIYFANCINNRIGTDCFYELKSDIDLINVNFIPIGISEYRKFNGYFNGNGYEVLNCNINTLSTDLIGLFGYSSGIIENLGINNILIDSEFYYDTHNFKSLYIGTIVGKNNGVIENCYSFGNINLKYLGGRINTLSPIHINVGGISALNEGVIQNSYTVTNVDIEHNDRVGTINITGIAIGGKIEGCLTILHKKIKCPLLNYLDDVKEYDIGTNDVINSYFFIENKENFYNLCTIEELNSINFYLEKLYWDDNKWKLDNIQFCHNNYVNNNYPKLIVNNK